MKRWILTLISACLLAPSIVFAADSCDSSVYLYDEAPVCACYFNGSYCDVFYPTSSGYSEASCTTDCKLAYGDAYASSSYHDGKDTCEGKGVATKCSASNATARLAETDQAVAAALEAGANTPSYATPQLSVDIPGVDFVKTLYRDGKLESNFLGAYISGVYKFLIGFAISIAIVMVMVGGLQYVIGASSGEIGKAKNRIVNAITGFILLLFVYVILYLVNPELTVFKNLEITVIPPSPEEYEDDFITNGSVATNFSTPDGTNISGAGKTKIPSELTADIESAAQTLASWGYGMSIASSFRSVEKQRELIYRNCQNPPGSSTCNRKPDKPTTCILKDNNAANCPHTTGRALDIWGTTGGSQCISQDACLSDPAACRANTCQAAVISAMKTAGFCNLKSEPWHFEKPKMSSTCN